MASSQPIARTSPTISNLSTTSQRHPIEPYNGGIPLESSFGEGIHIHTHTGVPYNFYMPLPTNEQWGMWTLQHRCHILVKIPKMATIPLIGTKYTSF
jgi:hypothetical protein